MGHCEDCEREGRQWTTQGLRNCSCGCGPCRAQVDEDLRARIERAMQGAVNQAVDEVKRLGKQLEEEIKRRLPQSDGTPPSGGNVNIKGSRNG